MIDDSATPAVGESDATVLLPLVAGAWQAAGRRVTIDVQGVSMAPLIRAGDRLTLQMKPPGTLRAGDVFVFLRDRRLIVHRLITKRRKGTVWRFCEKGDGLPGWTWVEESAVVGSVVEIVRGTRRLDLQRLPWRWVNPAVALAWRGWIAGYERLREVKLRRRGACR